MIGMHVGANDTDHGLAAQRIGKNVLPHLGGLLVRQTRVDNPPTVVVFQKIHIDEDHIKEVGKYTATVKLYKNVAVDISLDVTGE